MTRSTAGRGIRTTDGDDREAARPEEGTDAEAAPRVTPRRPRRWDQPVERMLPAERYE